MNNIIITLKRSIFPITKFYLTIGENDFSINPGETKKIELSKDGTYEITATSYWLNTKGKLFLKNQSRLSIKHIIPDLYYLLGGPIVIILSILTFMNLVNVLLFSGIVLLFLSPILYFTFLQTKSYFKIEGEEKS